MSALWSAHPEKLLAVCDISCDIGGGVEFLTKSTYVEKPFFMWDPATQETHAIRPLLRAAPLRLRTLAHLFI